VLPRILWNKGEVKLRRRKRMKTGRIMRRKVRKRKDICSDFLRNRKN